VKSGGLSIEKVGEWYVESQHLQGYCPQLCRLRTDGLPLRASIERTDLMPVIWTGKPSSRPSTKGWLCPHCFIGWLGREIGYRSVDWSAGVLWIVPRALFLMRGGPAQLC
jgi:hypothetical protein